MNLINFCVITFLEALLFTNFAVAELNLLWNIPFEKLSEESGYTHLDRHSIVRDLSLTQAKKENRILPIILIKGKPLLFEVQCVMDGFNKQLSKGIPTLRTTLDRTDEEKVYEVDFEDPVNKQASWKSSFSITNQDKGMQIITCDYEQDNYGKTIELTLEIYATVNDVETENLACVNDEMKCKGTLLIPYEGGKERNKWIKEELKDQALKLFNKSATFNDGKPENNFKVELDFENLDDADKKRYLGDIATDPQKLCKCVPPPAPPVTPTPPPSTPPPPDDGQVSKLLVPFITIGSLLLIFILGIVYLKYKNYKKEKEAKQIFSRLHLDKDKKASLRKFFNGYGTKTDKSKVGEQKVFLLDKDEYFYILNHQQDKIPPPKYDENKLIDEDNFVKWYIEEYHGDLYFQLKNRFSQLIYRVQCCKKTENNAADYISLQEQGKLDVFGKSV